jgi:hypothetical protein
MADPHVEINITISDISEEAVHALVYGEELWPDIVIEDVLDADVVDG